jgi:hypothetical protein
MSRPSEPPVTVSVKVKNEQQLVSAAASSATRPATCGSGRRSRCSLVGAVRSAPCTTSENSWSKAAIRSGCSAVGSVHASGTHAGPGLISIRRL